MSAQAGGQQSHIRLQTWNSTKQKAPLMGSFLIAVIHKLHKRQRFWLDCLSYIQHSGQLLSHNTSVMMTLLPYTIPHVGDLESFSPLRPVWLPKLLWLCFEKFSKKSKSQRNKPSDYNSTVPTFLPLGRQWDTNWTKCFFLMSVMSLALILCKTEICIWHTGPNNFKSLWLVRYDQYGIIYWLTDWIFLLLCL